MILRAPGTNCDLETQHAFELAGAKAERLHVNRLLEQPRILDGFQVLCVPGGFSYGDDIAAGRILATQLAAHLAGAVGDFKHAGKLVLGICNGFQILLKSGLLLDDAVNGAGGNGGTFEPCATLTWNASGRFIDRWVNLEMPGNSKCVFFRGIEWMYLPIAHAEGKFVVSSNRVLDSLAAAGQIAAVYRTGDNPNGAAGDVAGICDSTGRVCGIMPHPERHVDPTQHPRWTRGEAGPVGDGLAVFQNAVRYFE